MKAAPSAPITQLLRNWSQGDETALERLLPLVYDELHGQAARLMRLQAPGHTLQTTALVHEAYLRLVDQESVPSESRSHFFGVAAKAMRCILVDHARAQRAAKRGGAAARLPLEHAGEIAGPAPGVDVLALDEALSRLAELDPRKSRLVELRYFAGLSVEEVAAALGLSLATVKREWALARAWLKRELTSASDDELRRE
jgi:RNA polymerase sigma factor (TIGR02999 family)